MMDMPDSVLTYYDMSEVHDDVTFSAEQQTVLDRINQKVAAAASVESLIDFLFDEVGSICSCDRVAMAFVIDEGRRVVAHYAHASYEPLILGKGYSEQLRGSTLEDIIETGRVRVIGDLQAYLNAKPQSESTKLVCREGIRSSMTCPLSVDGRNVGLLFRSSRQRHAYDIGHVRFHWAIAERLAQAVEKAWRIEQLAESNRAYTEMLGFVSHELKSPVASMIMDAELLVGGYMGEMSDEQIGKIRGMMAKGDYLLGLVNDYLNLARLEGGDMDLNSKIGVDFAADVIAPAIDIVRPQMDAASMRLVMDIPAGAVAVSLECDPGLMKIVAVNLLSNAAKYGVERGEIRVTVGVEDGWVQFSVRNEGPGFDEAAKSKLFRKFSRLDDPELRKRKGTGVGLYTVWRIVHKHGGTIVADSQKGEWAEFTVKLPQQPVSQ